MPPLSNTPPGDARSLLAKTDLCVQCGLCLPQCPTYGLFRSEAESPRGRIALIQGSVNGAIGPDAALFAHLDHCLGCEACEAVCPSRVPFGAIMDTARAALEPARHRRPGARLLRRALLDGLVPRPAALRFTARLLRAYQRSGLQRALRRSGLLGTLRIAQAEALLPTLAPVRRWPEFTAARGPRRGSVALVTGCVASVADRPTLEAAVRVLSRLGFDVHIPAAQTCCGALHQHEGRPGRAKHLAQANVTAFGGSGAPVLVLASGCCAQLLRYGDLLGTAQAAGFAARVRDIGQFLVESDWPANVQAAPLRARVAVHEPCTLRNAVRQPDKPYRLLERVPGLELASATGAQCCGAGGAHLLHHADDAARLREPTLRAVRALRPHFLVTSNFGCAVHLAAGLREDPQAPQVMHPVTLLERQLDTRDTNR